MDIDKMLADAIAEQATLHDKITDVQRLIKVLRDMAYGSSKGDENRVVTVTTVEYPSPRDAILTAMNTTPGRALEPRQVTGIIKQLGLYNETLKSGGTAYSTALSRLAEDSESQITRDMLGLYTYLPTAAQVLAEEV